MWWNGSFGHCQRSDGRGAAESMSVAEEGPEPGDGKG